MLLPSSFSIHHPIQHVQPRESELDLPDVVGFDLISIETSLLLRSDSRTTVQDRAGSVDDEGVFGFTFSTSSDGEGASNFEDLRRERRVGEREDAESGSRRRKEGREEEGEKER